MESPELDSISPFHVILNTMQTQTQLSVFPFSLIVATQIPPAPSANVCLSEVVGDDNPDNYLGYDDESFLLPNYLGWVINVHIQGQFYLV